MQRTSKELCWTQERQRDWPRAWCAGLVGLALFPLSCSASQSGQNDTGHGSEGNVSASGAASGAEQLLVPRPGEGMPFDSESTVEDGAPDQRTASGSLEDTWCSAIDVISANCQGCHTDPPRFGAPMPLLTETDFLAPAPSDSARTVVELVAERIHDERAPMPPGGMAADQVAVLDAWTKAGAPAGESSCGSAAPASELEGQLASEEFSWPDDCEEFFTLTVADALGATGDHVVAPGAEEHPQFIFDAPWGSDDVQILAHRPVVDNARVLHHWILYENGGGLFGGAFGGKFLVGWAPGSQGSTGDMPEDVGMYAPGGEGSLRLDMHYYNLGNAQGESDDSGVELCITRSPRPSTATVMGLIGDATAPVGRSDNATSCTASVTPGQSVRLLSVSPHMHQLGVHAKLELTRAGETVALHDAPFDFEDQKIFPLDGVEVRDGDVLTTTCSYVNTTGRTVSFGQDSDDEMCFNFVTYYPMDALRCGFSL